MLENDLKYVPRLRYCEARLQGGTSPSLLYCMHPLKVTACHNIDIRLSACHLLRGVT